MKVIECNIVHKVKQISELQNRGSKCSDCGNLIDIGDYLDSHFPYFDNYNYCNKCWNANN